MSVLIFVRMFYTMELHVHNYWTYSMENAESIDPPDSCIHLDKVTRDNIGHFHTRVQSCDHNLTKKVSRIFTIIIIILLFPP